MRDWSTEARVGENTPHNPHNPYALASPGPDQATTPPLRMKIRHSSPDWIASPLKKSNYFSGLAQSARSCMENRELTGRLTMCRYFSTGY